MNRIIVGICGFLLFSSSANALTCNQWYDTMGGFIEEGKQIRGVLSSIKADAAATCTYRRQTQIPIMRRNLQMIQNFIPCGGQTGLAARDTADSIERVLKRLLIDTQSKCAAATN